MPSPLVQTSTHAEMSALQAGGHEVRKDGLAIVDQTGMYSA